MKPFLGIDITNNKKNDRENGDTFAVATASYAHTRMLDNANQNAAEMEKRAKLPLPLRILYYISGFLGATFAIGLLRAMSSVTLNEAYGNAPWVFWICGVCLAIFVPLSILTYRTKKKVSQSKEANTTETTLENAIQSIYTEFEVPANAKNVDVLTFYYKTNNEKIVAKAKGMMPEYINYEMKAYVSEDTLYLVGLEKKYAFALSSLRTIRTVKKTVFLPYWHKELVPQDKAYKLDVNNMGWVFTGQYHILSLEHNGEEWGIYFPCYELSAMEALTGLHAEPIK